MRPPRPRSGPTATTRSEFARGGGLATRPAAPQSFLGTVKRGNGHRTLHERRHSLVGLAASAREPGLPRLLVHAAGGGLPDSFSNLPLGAGHLAQLHRYADRAGVAVLSARRTSSGWPKTRSSGSRSSTPSSIRWLPRSSSSPWVSTWRSFSTTICPSRPSSGPSCCCPSSCRRCCRPLPSGGSTTPSSRS